MRTTIDLADDLHELARQAAHGQRRSISSVIDEWIRRGLTGTTGHTQQGPLGFPVVTLGRPVTAEDVAASDDE
jgi:hypothetical protein